MTAVNTGIWAYGDYHAFAKQFTWEVGPALVEACAITRDDRVLDVAAGTGNVALRAAGTGASVVATDLTPEHFEAGRAEAAAMGVEVEWVEADAAALPFGAGEFDAVTSCFGVMFVPDHQRAADELVRVCRPGGRIAIASFVAEGTAGALFDLFGRYAPPPPPGAASPLLWGSEDHVRDLLGDRVTALSATRRSYRERAATAQEYCWAYRRTFGPLIAIEESLAPDADRAAEFEREFARFAERADVGPEGGPAEYEYEYLLVTARVR